MPRVKVRGAEVYFRQRGKGQPLLLIHGWNASSAMWSLNLGDLATRRRAIAPDLPGHGRSSLPDGFRFTLEGFADFLEELRKALFLRQMDLVGHSMGGCICLTYTLLHPQRVRRLVLVDAPWRRSSLSLPARFPLPTLVLRGLFRLRGPRVNRFLFVQALRNPQEIPAEVVEENVREAGMIPRDAFVSTTLMVRRLGLDLRGLSSLELPVLLLWGERDRAVRPSEGKRLRELLPDSRLILLPDAAHSPQLDNAELFDRLVLEFLEEEMPGQDALSRKG